MSGSASRHAYVVSGSSLTQVGTVEGPPEGLRNPLDATKRVRAVLFDLDGTLYDQRRMRASMAAELLLLPLRQPREAIRTFRGLRAYRKALEHLRSDALSPTGTFAPDAQLERAATRCAIPETELALIVEEWMVQRPLKHMAACRPAGLVDLLKHLEAAGVELGVLSDYPGRAKLAALGIAEYFSVVLSTSDVGAVKPNPRGFLEAARRWQLVPGEVLVVGDRLDADAAGAAAAGMPCVVIGSTASNGQRGDALILPSLERLHRVLVN